MGLSNYQMFADDTMTERTGNSINEVNKLLHNDIDKVMLWLKQNRLQINVDKSCMMYIGSCQLLNNLNDNILSKPEIKVQSFNIVESCKYLGLILDSNTSWSKYINNLCSKLS